MFKKKLFYLSLITGLTLPLMAQSATYYVSSRSGNDANDGLRENSPWQTLDQVNTVQFQNNDTILFKRGEVFRGAINTSKFPQGLTFSDYGTGPKNPVIAGSVAITGWTLTKSSQINKAIRGQVFEADVSALPLSKAGIEHLFVNGELMTIARYPNVDAPNQANWLKVGATAGKNGFTDPNLAAYGKPNNYWKGATLRIRNYSWTYTVTEVTGYSAANGKITAERLDSQLPEWGYFLDGKLGELDHPGEWHYDADANKVYLYPRNNADPNTLLIEGSTFDIGITLTNQENGTVIENLTFRHFTDKGVHAGGSDDCIVRNNHFEHNVRGLSAWNSPNVLISNNTFTRHLHTAINLQGSSGFDVQNSIAEKNTITDTALYPVYGVRFDGVYGGIGISVFGEAYTVRQNTIENTGWVGTYLKDGGHHLIENNVIRNSLLWLNDGGAIQIGSDGNTIRGNFLFSSVGNVDESNGCGNSNTPCMHHPSYGMGIGADNNFKNNVIEGNTVANNAHQGIRLNAFLNTQVQRNVVYNNQNQIVVEDKKGPSRNNMIERNIFYALRPEQFGLKLTNQSNHGQIDNNVYCNAFSDITLQRDIKNYSLGFWQQEFSTLDQKSKACKNHPKLAEYTVSEVGNNLVGNSTFDQHVENWKGSGAAVISHDSTQAQMKGGSLKAVYQGKNNANVISNTFELGAGQLYRLQFSVIGHGFGTLQLRINDSNPDQTTILKEQFFGYSATRRDYELFFNSRTNVSIAKILFITKKEDADYWLDNVSFAPVKATLNDLTQKVPLFINPTVNPSTIDLGSSVYQDLNGNTVTGSLNLQPYSSQILILLDGEPVITNIPEATPVQPVAELPGNSLNEPGEQPTAGESETEQPTSPFEQSEPPPPPPTREEKIATVVANAPKQSSPKCSKRNEINKSCKNQTQEVIKDRTVGKQGSINGGEVAGTIENQGLVSNITVQPEGRVNGGKLTGTIKNQGTLADFEFVGAEVIGGTLSGTILNQSRVGGTFTDVQLAPQTHLKGGFLQGNITGDADEPALLEELTVKSNSHLSNVSLGENVTLADDVILDNVYFYANSIIENVFLQNNLSGDVNAPARLENVTIAAGSHLSGVTLGSGISLAEKVTFGEAVQVESLPILGAAFVTEGSNEAVENQTYFAGGLAVQGGPFDLATTHPFTDDVEIKGRIIVTPEHVGQKTDIIVYVAYWPLDATDGEPQYVMLDENGTILPWENGDFDGLVPFQSEVFLRSTLEVPIYLGQIPATGIIKISFGYRLSTGIVVQNQDTIDVTVTN